MSTAFGAHLAIRIVSREKDRIVGEMLADSRHLNPAGVLHGGAVMGFADEVGAAGAVFNLPPGSTTTTIESKTNFFRGCRPGTLRAEAVPLHIGRKTQVWQTSIFDSAGKRVALVTQTQIVLPGPEPVPIVRPPEGWR